MKNMSHIRSQRLFRSYILSSSFSSHKFLTETFCNTATKTKFVVILDSYIFLENYRKGSDTRPDRMCRLTRLASHTNAPRERFISADSN